jgi:hypothetical protein
LKDKSEGKPQRRKDAKENLMKHQYFLSRLVRGLSIAFVAGFLCVFAPLRLQ